MKEKRKKFKRIQDQNDSSASSSHEESDAGEEVIDLASESNSASENEDEESPDSSAAAEERRLKKQSTKKNKSKRIGDTFGSPQKHWPWKSIRFVDENSDEENEEPNDDSRTDEPVRRKKSGSKHSTDSTPVKNKLVDDGEVPGSSTGSKRSKICCSLFIQHLLLRLNIKVLVNSSEPIHTFSIKAHKELKGKEIYVNTAFKKNENLQRR